MDGSMRDESSTASYPQKCQWADRQTLEIYLMGLDTGEQWALDNFGFRNKPDPCLLENASISFPSDCAIIDREKAEA
jgi:hypothetical protein